MAEVDSNPTVPTTPSGPPPLPFPVEIIHSILSHLLPIKDHATLSHLSHTSKLLHEITFPYLNHTLVLKKWTPASVLSLETYLAMHDPTACAIKYLVLPEKIVDRRSWTEEWVDKNWERFLPSPGSYRSDEGHWFPGWEDAELEKEDDAREAARDSEELREDLMEDEAYEWIVDRSKCEWAFFQLIKLLPRLGKVELSEFMGEERVGEFMERIRLIRAGLRSMEEGTAFQQWLASAEARDGPLGSYIHTVRLRHCSQRFTTILHHHWRFSKVSKVIKYE